MSSDTNWFQDQHQEPKPRLTLPSLLAILALVAVVAFALTGCTGLPGMTPEQLEAAGKAKDVSVVCAMGTGPWGKVQTIYLNIDRTVIKNGSVLVDDACKVTFANKEKP